MKDIAYATIVAVIALFLTAMLLPSDSFRRLLQEDIDESKLYVLEDTLPLRFHLPPGLETIRLHVVAEVDAPPTYRADDRIPMAVNIRFLNAEGIGVEEPRTLELDSRISISSNELEKDSKRGSMSNSDDFLTDNRNLSFPVPRSIRESGGSLQLFYVEGGYQRLLVRGFADSHRALTFGDVELDRLTQRRANILGTGLGIRNLPEGALSARRYRSVVRLYTTASHPTETVLFSSYRRPWFDPRNAEQYAQLPCNSLRWIALNMNGKNQLRIESEFPTAVRIDESSWLDLTQPQTVEVDAGEGRTITLQCRDQTKLKIRTTSESAARQLGDEKRTLPASSNEFYILPDFRRAWYFQLSNEPVLLPPVAQTRKIRFSFRNCLPHESETKRSFVRARILVRLDGDVLFDRVLEEERERSMYETFRDCGAATKNLSKTIEIPAGSDISIWGNEATWARFAAEIPENMELIRLPWRDQIPPNMKWHYAPRELTRYARLRPQRYGILAREGRLDRLIEQVRLLQIHQDEDRLIATVPSSTSDERSNSSSSNTQLENREGTNLQQRPPSPFRVMRRPLQYMRTLLPQGNPLSHRVHEIRPGVLRNANSWTPLLPSRRIQVTASDDPFVWIESTRVGESASLILDGDVIWSGVLTSSVVRIPLPVPVGTHELRFEGSGQAFTNIAPLRGPIHKRRRYYRLDSSAPLHFEFPARTSERQTVVFYVLSEQTEVRYILRHEQVGGVGLSQATHRGRTGRYPLARFWDAEQQGEVGRGRVAVPLGIAPDSRTRSIRLYSENSQPLWVRTILLSSHPHPQSERWRSSVRSE